MKDYDIILYQQTIVLYLNTWCMWGITIKSDGYNGWCFPSDKEGVTIGRSLFMRKERESQKLTQIQGLWYCPRGQVSMSWYMYLLDCHNRKAKVNRIAYVHLSILESTGHISDTWMYVWMMSKFTHYGRNFTWFPLNPDERNALFMVNSAFVAWRYYFC